MYVLPTVGKEFFDCLFVSNKSWTIQVRFFGNDSQGPGKVNKIEI